jgi:hypothetical protein
VALYILIKTIIFIFIFEENNFLVFVAFLNNIWLIVLSLWSVSVKILRKYEKPDTSMQIFWESGYNSLCVHTPTLMVIEAFEKMVLSAWVSELPQWAQPRVRHKPPYYIPLRYWGCLLPQQALTFPDWQGFPKVYRTEWSIV